MDTKKEILNYEYSEFTHWFNELECYGLRSERFFDLINNEKDVLKRFQHITKWMEASFDMGRRLK